MSILTAKIKIPEREHVATDFFSLSFTQQNLHTEMTMFLHTPTVTTESIKETLPILEKFLPSILRSMCFNDAHLPFSKEVTKTEIGHLFEHILLEYLCEIKIIAGYKNPVHNGITQWDWLHDTQGTFHIQVDAGKEDRDIFFQALSKSISLLEEILEYDPIKKRKEIIRKPFAYQLQ